MGSGEAAHRNDEALAARSPASAAGLKIDVQMSRIDLHGGILHCIIAFDRLIYAPKMLLTERSRGCAWPCVECKVIDLGLVKVDAGAPSYALMPGAPQRVLRRPGQVPKGLSR